MRFFTDLCSKNVMLHKRRHQFRIVFCDVFCLSDTFLRFTVRMYVGCEKLPKKLPKRGSNPVKIDVENVLFLDIDFFVFWHRFWRVLVLQDGINLAPSSIFEFIRLPSLTFLSERSFKNGVLQASGLDFGGPKARFWRVLGQFLRLLSSKGVEG